MENIVILMEIFFKNVTFTTKQTKSKINNNLLFYIPDNWLCIWYIKIDHEFVNTWSCIPSFVKFSVWYNFSKVAIDVKRVL